jgi:uncharacterized protein YjdB
MRTRSLIAILALVVAGAWLIGCDDFFVDTGNCTAVNVTPTTSSIGVGQTQQFAATCTINTGGSQTITNTATWSSNTPSIATVTNTGFAAGVSPGSATISATSNGLSGSANMTVNPPSLTSIAITPAGATISTATQQFTATGTFSSGSHSDITTAVTWSVDNQSIATISSAVGSQGLLTKVTSGTVTVTATLGTVTFNTTATLQ